MLKFDDFAKLEMKIGTILKAERVPDTKNLLKVIVDMGNEKKQVVVRVFPCKAPYTSYDEIMS